MDYPIIIQYRIVLANYVTLNLMETNLNVDEVKNLEDGGFKLEKKLQHSEEICAIAEEFLRKL